jgi:hypothetical protein
MYDCIYNNRLIGAFGDETGWYGGGWGAAVSNDLRGLPGSGRRQDFLRRFQASRMTKSGTDTYMSTWGAGVYKSTDYGESWFAVNKGLTAAR